MMSNQDKFQTDQEMFWAGQFGDDYISRNNSEQIVSSNTHLFSNIFEHTKNVQSVIELGSNIGMNLWAIKRLLPTAEIHAVEINKKAFEEVQKIPSVKAYNESLLSFSSKEKYDFVFTKGVLIHQNPDVLKDIYKKMYELSSNYICLVEYYNPSPVEISYRGHSGKLFKRDFAGDLMDMYPDLELVHYDFFYRRDNNFKLDDLTCFLLKKKR
jgi:spore coat polysaccharide biosynthesis protein SpsF